MGVTAISTRTVNGRTYRREPVRTHKVGIGEDLGGVIALYAAERITPQTRVRFRSTNAPAAISAGKTVPSFLRW